MKYTGAIILALFMLLSLGCDGGSTASDPLVGTWIMDDDVAINMYSMLIKLVYLSILIQQWNLHGIKKML